MPPEESDEEISNGRMGFLEHLDELRTRLIRSCLAIAGGMLVAFAFVARRRRDRSRGEFPRLWRSVSQD